jgi:endonuclease/exonuclease/phosphatase (EEP) superfamily protein YafD
MDAQGLLRFTLSGLGYLLVFISLVPLIRSDKWFVRVFDYPRSQKFWINLGISLAFLTVADFREPSDIVFMAVIFLNQIYLFTQIWDYTKLAGIQMKKGPETRGETIKLLVANVYQDNRDTTRIAGLIHQYAPDLILLVEMDEWWVNALALPDRDYPHRIINPLDNTYGMVLYSRLKIVRYAVQFLVEDDVPSLVADLETRDRKMIRLYGLHPKPPVPGESDDSTERDAEILIVGREAKKCKYPVIVAGDLNDVAWSYTTNLFLKVSGLLDPRIGRGFFSTFHADYRLMRWPLDHVFCSSHFYLHELKRLPSIGSDHFPMFIEVGLMEDTIPENEAEEKKPEASDISTAGEKIEAAR